MIDPKTIAESGLLLVDKPEDWTSHDVVNFVRKRFNVRKVGHCGTLDPMATGLLVLVLGRATKLSAQLSGQDKWYEGTIRFGIETATHDREGEVIATCDCGHINEEDVRCAMDAFRGELLQVPPMVSAIKKNGKPLYKLARKGVEVEREARPVTVHSFEALRIAMPDLEFNLHCSKGTYVRTLADDLGRKLGCGAHLHSLRRTRSGAFCIDRAVSIDLIKGWEREELLGRMIPLEHVLSSL